MSPIKDVPADEVSVAAKRRFLYRLLFVLCGGMFLDGYILGIIGPVIETITEDLQISAVWEGLIGAAALFGIFIGSPLGGWAGDRFGRKPMFMLDIALFCVASALQFVVQEPWQLFVVRLLMGIAIGMEYSVGWPLMAEFAPARLRGRLMGVTLIAWYVGFMVAFTLGYVLSTTALNWRLTLGTSTILAVILLLARLGLPESPRWLWSKGRHQEAHDIAHRYMEDPTEMDDVEHEHDRKGTFGELFSKPYWRATVFVSVFWFCAVSPYFAIATFADPVLKSYGLGGGLAGGVGLSAVSTLGVIVTVLLVDRIGRRPIAVPTMWLCFVLLAIIGLWAGAPATVVLICFLAFSFVNAMPNTLTGVYPGEVFPTEIRGIGTGFAAAFSRVGAGLATFGLPVSMASWGSGPTMLIAAGVALIGAIVTQILAPETKGMHLSDAAAGLDRGHHIVMAH
jgi:MFS transporter, putative metabolite transport protein